MPNLEHDHFPLIGGQAAQCALGGELEIGLRAGGLEPADRFPFALEAAEPAAPGVERAIAISANGVVRRIVGGSFQSHQREESFLEGIFRFGLRKPQRTAVQNEFGGFLIVKPLAPIRCREFAHSTHKDTIFP